MNIKDLKEILNTMDDTDVVLNKFAVEIHCVGQNVIRINEALMNYKWWKQLHEDIQAGKYEIKTNNGIYTLINVETSEIPIDPSGTEWKNLESSKISVMEAVVHDNANRYKKQVLNYLGLYITNQDWAEMLIKQ